MEKNNRFDQTTIKQELEKAKKELKESRAEKVYFRINDYAETIGRCYCLLGDQEKAREHFQLAAEANLKALENYLAKEGKGDPDAQWGYLFESLWLFYLSRNYQKVQGLADRLTILLKQWPEPVPLLQRIEITLACYVAGKTDQAKKWYQHFNLSRYEKTSYHSEIKLLKAGLEGNKGDARLAIEVIKQAIVRNEIKPWYYNNYEYDFLLMAEKLLEEEGKPTRTVSF